jgi:hypothetical protein
MRRGGLIYWWRRRNAPEWKSLEQRVLITWAARHLVVSALGLSVPSMERLRNESWCRKHIPAAEWLHGLA